MAQQRQPVAGGRNFPSVRYSASAVSYKGEMIVTHGYFYNHGLRHPAWQSNAWAFNFASQNWRQVHEGERAGAPSARYSASAVLYDHALWMYGGDDGGHKKSMFNYIFQAWFDELWRFDLRTYVWHKVSYNSAAPSKRALHSAVVVDKSMYVYGGLELADTWRYDFEPSTWTLLIATPADGDETHPGALRRCDTTRSRALFSNLPTTPPPFLTVQAGGTLLRRRQLQRAASTSMEAAGTSRGCVRKPSTTCGTTRSAAMLGASSRPPPACRRPVLAATCPSSP